VDYCGVGCQSKFGECNKVEANKKSKTITTKKSSKKNTTSSKKSSTKKSSKNISTTSKSKKITSTKKNKKTTTTQKTKTINSKESNISTNGKCGPKNGNKVCPKGKCCSKKGYCGETDAYCKSGCLSEFGVCKDTKRSSTKLTSNKKTTSKKTSTKKTTSKKSSTKKTSIRKTSTKKTTTKPITTKKITTKPITSKTKTSNISRETSLISKNGKCGPKNGNTICPNNKYCSQYGYCGTSKAYCGKGCQSEFGKCNQIAETSKTKTSAKKKTTTTTSKTTKSSTKKTTTTTTTTEKITSTKVSAETNLISTDGTCGLKHGNKICPENECCGSDGKCAFNNEACGVGCQKEFGGYCLPENYEEYLCEECVDCIDCSENLFYALRCPSTCASDPDHLDDDYQEIDYKEGEVAFITFGDDGTKIYKDIYGNMITVIYPEDKEPKTTTKKTPTATATVASTSTSSAIKTNSISTDGTCGPKHGNKACPEYECCGSDGKCAFNNEACGVGCQKEFGYYCLPEDYEEYLCVECVDCIDCSENLFYALRCPSTCASDPDHLDDDYQEIDYKEGEVAFITFGDDGTKIYKDIYGNMITVIYPEDKEPKTTTKKTPTATATVASTSTSSAIKTNSISTDGTCGPKHGNKACPEYECCGSDGKCAFNNEACGVGCQKEFGYYCLPEDYEEYLCVECVDCIDCSENLFYALRCPSTCASYP